MSVGYKPSLSISLLKWFFFLFFFLVHFVRRLNPRLNAFWKFDIVIHICSIRTKSKFLDPLSSFSSLWLSCDLGGLCLIFLFFLLSPFPLHLIDIGLLAQSCRMALLPSHPPEGRNTLDLWGLIGGPKKRASSTSACRSGLPASCSNYLFVPRLTEGIFIFRI